MSQTGDAAEQPARSHWEAQGKWPGLVMVAVIAVVLVGIWAIASATRSHPDPVCSTVSTANPDAGVDASLIVRPSSGTAVLACK